VSQDLGAQSDHLGQVTTYNWLSRQFHWIIAALIFMAFALGLTMEPLELSKDKLNFYAWHKWLGLIILSLVLLRLIWRLITKVPTHQSVTVPPLFHFGAKVGHFLLYAVLIILPLIGWLRSSSAGFEIVLFEVIPIPDLLGKDEVLSNQLAFLHKMLAYFLALLVLGHVVAVFIHHQIFKDPILNKMKPHLLHKLLIVATLLGGVVFYGFYVGFAPKAALEDLESKASVEKAETKTSFKEMPSKTAERKTNWAIDKTVSLLEFTATQKSAKTSGTFKTYQLKQLVFEVEDLAGAVVEIEIDVASLSLSNLLVEQTLGSSQWFNVGEFPKANFISKEFKSLGGGLYEIRGDLKIKDIVQPVIVKLTIIKTVTDQSGDVVIEATGETVISRLGFKIGQGEWASTDDLADEVQLKIHIRALKTR
jgi:cytochrome b561